MVMKLGSGWLVLWIILATVGIAEAEPGNIGGTWKVTSKIIATTVPTPQVKEGFKKVETWNIKQTGMQAIVTTPAGAIAGRFVADTPEFPKGVWTFTVRIERLLGQSNLAGDIELIIQGNTGAVLKGGSSITYLGIDYALQRWVPVGKESWTFEGVRVNK
jgi:hypothetical protein